MLRIYIDMKKLKMQRPKHSKNIIWRGKMEQWNVFILFWKPEQAIWNIKIPGETGMKKKIRNVSYECSNGWHFRTLGIGPVYI